MENNCFGLKLPSLAKNTKFFVLDKIPGSGKTTSAIEFMRNNQDKYNFVYVGLFNEELERVQSELKNFIIPDYMYSYENNTRTKLNNLKSLLSDYDNNLLTTHSSLFNVCKDVKKSLVNDEKLELPNTRGKERVMIIDECLDNTIQVINVGKYRELIKSLLELNIIEIDNNNLIKVINPREICENFDWLYALCNAGNVYCIYDEVTDTCNLLSWTLPLDFFKQVDKIIFMTYGFEYQIFSKLMKINNLKYTFIESDFNFSNSTYQIPEFTGNKFKHLINIYQGKRNLIGEKNSKMRNEPLTANWYSKAQKDKITNIANEVRGWIRFDLKLTAKDKVEVYQNDNTLNDNGNIDDCNPVKVNNVISNNIIYTVPFARENDVDIFDRYDPKTKQAVLYVKDYKDCFLSSYTRSTNHYRNITNVAYCINKYHNPMIEGFLHTMNLSFSKEEQNNYAICEMIQFIYRSALRTGNKINLFVPSERMRNLLIEWLNK